MANAKIGVDFDPVRTQKVDAALARIQSQAKGVDFGAGARSISKLSRPLGKITGQATEFQKSLEASNARVLAFGASVAVINKLSEAFGALVNNTIKVEATFAKINTILGGTQKELDEFGNGIFRVAQKTGTSFDQVADGALELARQGLSVSESLSRVETALKLVRVAGVDSEKAVAGLTAAVKGFGDAGLNVATIADKLSAADTAFAVSTDDLINGLERAAASARVAGVSFDELLAVVTTVQERTQRGGAVIGNAFKTIFARLARVDNLRTLQDLGIQVTDAENNIRSAIPLIIDFAKELDNLGIRSEKATKLIDQVAGVRQRDILISLVEDLNSSQSQFSKVLNETANATGALDRKNKQLNDTIEALINNVTIAGQKLASSLGEIGFTDTAKDLLTTFGNAIDGINDLLDGDGIGSRFAQGIIKGLGSVLTGPGLAIVGAVFTKLFIDLAKFGASSLQSLLGINTAAQQQAALQQSIFQTLIQNESIQEQILRLEGDKIAQEQLLLRIYTQQIDALNKVQNAAARVTPGLFGAGLRGSEGGVTRRGAGGYVAAEARDVSRGVGGASPNSKVVSIPNFAFGGGQRGTMVANTSEYYVPNYAGGDAIFNQNMVRSMGLPKGAKKLTASGGFIPNFAAPKNFQQYMQSRGLTPRSLPGSYRSTTYDAAYRTDSPYRQAYDALTPTQQRNIAKGVQQKGVLSKTAKGKAKFGLLYSDAVGGTPPQVVPTRKGNIIQTIPIDTQPPNALYSDLRKNMVNTAVNFASTLGFSPDIVKDSNFKQIVDRNLNPGAVDAAFGSVFESAFQGALGIPLKSNEIFDLPSKGTIQKLVSQASAKGIIGRVSSVLTRLTAADFKNALNSDNVNSLDNKIANYKGRGASGFIPNFANPLTDAIGRERSAGLPISQIRINQSGKLRNAQNPMGLAVTNTRDEPTGAIPNFAASDNINVKQAFDEMNKAGKSAKELGQGMDGALTKVFALQIALSSVTNAFTEQGGAMQRFSSVLTDTINTLLVLQVAGISPTGGLFKGFGKGGFGALFKNLRSVTGIFGKLKMLAGPLAISFTALNGILKATTGKGVFGLFNDGLIRLGLAASETTKSFNELNKGLLDSTSDKPLGERIQSLIDARSENARKRAISQSGKVSKGTEIDENVARLIDLGFENVRNKGITGINPDFNLSDKVFKQVANAIGTVAIRSVEELEENLPGLNVAQYQEVLDAQREIFSKISEDLKTVTNPQKRAEYLQNVQLSIVDLYLGVRDDFEALQKTSKLEAQKALMNPQDASILLARGAASRQAATEARFLGLNVGDGGQVSLRNNIGGGSVAGTGRGRLADGTVELDDFVVSGQDTFAGIEKARVNATRATLRDLDYREEILQAELELQKVKDEQIVQLQDALELDKKTTGVNKENVEQLNELIKNGATFEEIQEKIQKTSLKDLGNVQSQLQESTKQIAIAKDAEVVDKNRAEYNKLIADYIASQTEGIAGYLNAADKQFAELEKEFPVTAAKNFENAMTNAFENIGEKGYDTIGGFLGNVVKDFGNEMMQEITRISARRIATSIVGSMSGEGQTFGSGGLFSNLARSLTGQGKGMANGGFVTGGSGVLDDVPARLMGGEFVVRKSAVQKYGKSFFDRLNNDEGTYTDNLGFTRKNEPVYSGGIFTPGTRGQGSIEGMQNLLAFATGQGGFTSDTTSRISSSRRGFSLDLEDQSRRLTNKGRFLIGSPSRDRLKDAQRQAFGLYSSQLTEDTRVKEEKEQAEKERRNMFKQMLVKAVFNAATAGISSSLSGPGAAGDLGATDLYQPQNLLNTAYAANGGLMSNSTNAMVMNGEYILGPQVQASLGRGMLDDINNLRVPMNFANGGAVGSADSGNIAKNNSEFNDLNININIDNNGNSNTDTEGAGDMENQGKSLARKIKEVVVSVINEEKRVSGSLFQSRR